MARVSLVEYVDSASTPWPASATKWTMPDSDYVISVGPDDIVIRFKDDKWFYFNRGIAANKKNYIALRYKGEPESTKMRGNLDESKSILVALDKHAFKSPGMPLGIASMNRYNLALQHVRRYCVKTGLSVFNVLADTVHLGAAYEQYKKAAPGSFMALHDLALKLSSLPLRYVGFKPASIPFVMERSASGDATREYHQTEIIPTQIYLDLLVDYKATVVEFLSVKDELLDFALRISNDKHYARNGNSHKGRSASYEDALEAAGLEEYAKKNNISSVAELARQFGAVYYASIMLIYAFTGMRKSEAYSLTLDSLKVYSRNGLVQARKLVGFTTKFRGLRKRVSWYTSVDVEAPFEAASFLCKLIMKCNKVDVPAQYLFISTGYLPFAAANDNLTSITSEAPTCGNYEPSKYQMHFSSVVIRAHHIEELKSINPFRVWEAESKFDVGRQWPLKIHQLRRSTAVYAIASGLVSLPALKEILKHLTLAMSRYYAKGSLYAPNILQRSAGDKDAWVVRYQESEVFVRSFQYVKELIIPDDVLKGPAGTWIERNSKPGLKSLGYAESLEQTLLKMKKGQIFYRPTPVGGCTLNDKCEKRIAVSFVGCDGCSNSAVVQSKLIKLIAIQEKVVTRLTGQPEFQFENNTLSELNDFAHRLEILQ
ncbi:tyrosine-type recombinase/integrase [Pseudomonas coleopterorum]|uniref:Tyrosine-type recombinase/integrase n=1 Tax=Pseudomonas coleopterorum TaxID=1605838 RepID=A0AAJ6M107_9PSED|nr:tyrosine-type recombinase/integrase [Pseudomonas coleopterorum]WNC10938.1 tyrosine-type recombinase/integrase [Pseudomonas coleopterorum]